MPRHRRPDLYLGMRPGDLDGRRYARYWNPDMAPLPDHVREALLCGAEAGELGLRLEEADRLMEAGHLPLETGWTITRDGHIMVAVLTHLPRATGAMFEWWMGWHYMEHQRYKLWHPRAHLGNGTREMRGDDPALSDREKYLTTHLVTEYIGRHLQTIAINFVEPSHYLRRTRDFGANGVTALFTATVTAQHSPLVIGHLVHQVRQVPGGSELRSRFWLGRPALRNRGAGDLRNRLLGSKLARSLLVPGDLAQAMLVHCAMEMNHLAAFLPDLYTDYH